MVICPILYGWIVGETGLALDFHTVWWGTFVFDIIVLALFLLLYRAPETPYDDADLEGSKFDRNAKPRLRDIFKSKAIIAMGLIFLFDEMAFMTINGFMSTYMTTVVGMTLIMANVFNTLYAVTGAIFAPLSGKISDVIKSRRWIILAGTVAGAIFSCIVFTATDEWIYWPLGIIAGMAGSCGPSLIWVAAPEQVPGNLVPQANGWLSFTQNLGMVIGSLILGNLVTVFGWTIASFTMLVPLWLICIVIFFWGMKAVR
jgi:predicted MFS family arabinose efflux permease